MKTVLITTISLISLMLGGCMTTQSSKTTPTTVSHIQLDNYLGKWYEIGRLPAYFQNKCTHNVTATYSLIDNGNINVLNACATDKAPTAINGEAYATDTSNAKLRVSFLPSVLKKLPIGKANYWVLSADQDAQGRYTSALVGTPDRKYLWILSRLPTLDDQTYERYLDIATQNGYDLHKFQKTPHK